MIAILKVIELFSGNATISQAFRDRGHETFTFEIDPSFNPDYCMDVADLSTDWILEHIGQPDFIWASPVCDTYSVIALLNHRDGIEPKTEKALFWDNMIIHVLSIISDLGIENWIMENPVGMLRKMPFMKGIPRRTITYCQYGDFRMKPTDLWGQRIYDYDLKPMCKKNAGCHESAPRGWDIETGTLKLDSKLRSNIPEDLAYDIAEQTELIINGKMGHKSILGGW